MLRSFRRLRGRSRGQSLVEFSLVVPLIVLLVLMGLDFGRIYLGWINLQSMSRVAANFAANHATSWTLPIDTAVQTEYRNLLAAEAQKINCTLPNPLPDPEFPSGPDLGDPAAIHISCQFAVLTPIISHIVGGQVLVSASSIFPVKQGAVTSITGGGGVVTPPAQAHFYASPNTGSDPLDVTFVNQSTNGPTSWLWTFGDSTSSFVANPPPHTYPQGTYTVSLTATNSGGSSTYSQTINVGPTPTTGPVPNFTADVRVGAPPLKVKFTDLSSGAPTSWNWTFGDGQFSSAQNPTVTYANPGVYTVTLGVTNGVGTNTETRQQYILVQCTVPNFGGTKKNDAQGSWNAAGFTTPVSFLSGSGNYTIRSQSLAGGLVNPPSGCGATITVGP